MLLMTRICILIAVLTGSQHISAQSIKTIGDSTIIKSVFHLKISLNLSDMQSDSCLLVYMTRTNSIDSLNKIENTVDERGIVLEGINQSFFQQMKIILTEKQWTDFIQIAIDRKNRLRERVKGKEIAVRELPETGMIQ